MSPTCSANPGSAKKSQKVTFTCSIPVCGSANVAMNIKRSGSTVGSGTNTATWMTTAENTENANVTCSADSGDPVRCNVGKSGTMLTSDFKEVYLNHVV